MKPKPLALSNHLQSLLHQRERESHERAGAGQFPSPAFSTCGGRCRGGFFCHLLRASEVHYAESLRPSERLAVACGGHEDVGISVRLEDAVAADLHRISSGRDQFQFLVVEPDDGATAVVSVQCSHDVIEIGDRLAVGAHNIPDERKCSLCGDPEHGRRAEESRPVQERDGLSSGGQVLPPCRHSVNENSGVFDNLS